MAAVGDEDEGTRHEPARELARTEGVGSGEPAVGAGPRRPTNGRRLLLAALVLAAWWLVSAGINYLLGGRVPTSIRWWVAAAGLVSATLVAVGERHPRVETLARPVVVLAAIGSVATLVVGGVVANDTATRSAPSTAATDVCEQLSGGNAGGRPTYDQFWQARTDYFGRWARARVADEDNWDMAFDTAYAAACPDRVALPETFPDGGALTVAQIDATVTALATDNGSDGSAAQVVGRDGRLACDRIRQGSSYEDITGILMASGHTDAQQAAVITAASVAEHCPSYAK